VFCQVEASASGRSLVQRSPTKGGVSEYDREASRMRPCPTAALASWGTNLSLYIFDKVLNTLLHDIWFRSARSCPAIISLSVSAFKSPTPPHDSHKNESSSLISCLSIYLENTVPLG
jgi:hypothetical protein